MKDKKIVHVLWRDSYGVSASWESLENLTSGEPLKKMTCESIGYMAFADDEHVVILPHYHAPFDGDGDGSGCGDMTIPRSSIIEIRELTDAS